MILIDRKKNYKDRQNMIIGDAAETILVTTGTKNAINCKCVNNCGNNRVL